MTSLPRTRPASTAVLLACVLLLAINLRPAITSLGPVVPNIAESTGMGAGVLGLLSAAPIVMFAIVSPTVHLLVERFGIDRTVTGSLAVLVAGTVLRSWPGPVLNVWLGMILVGATIAVGNVAVPVVVKRDFPSLSSRITGIYVATMSVSAALASGLAVPLAAATALEWRLSLGVWALPALVALAVWLPRALPAPTREKVVVTPGAGAARPESADAVTSVWRSPLAWQLSIYMGLQSTAFYVLLTWLPTVEQDLGVSPAAAGWHLFVMQIAGIAANLGAPVLMHRGRDQKQGAVVPGVLLIGGTLGLLAAPGLVLVWVAALGMGTGGAFVVALALMSLRAHDQPTASRLSAMAQAVGYTLAGLGLVLAGVLRDVTGGGVAILVLVAVLGAAVTASGFLVGRDRHVRVVRSVE